MTKSVLASIANGAKWTAITRIAIRLISLISTIILARLLSPHDFGLVALGMVFISFLTLLGTFDFETVLIQHPDPERQHYDTAWTLNALYFTLAALALVVFAPLLSEFYETPQLIGIIHLLAIGFLFKGLANVKIIDFQKHFRFRYDTQLKVSAKIAGFCTTITAAFLLRSYWALLIGMLASQATYLVMSYVLAPYRPRPTLSKTRELFSFSFWLMFSNIITFINSKSVEIIIGKMLGTGPLGIYTVGQSTASMATNELTSTINRAAYPGYAKVSNNVAELKRTVLRIVGVIAIVAFPASLGFYSIATPFVHVVLGDKWLPTVPVLQIIAISGLISSLQSPPQYVFYALNQPRLFTFISIAKAVIIVPLIYFMTLSNGIIGAALSIAITNTILLPANTYLLQRLINIQLKELLSALWRPMTASTVMLSALHLIFVHGVGIYVSKQPVLLLIAMVAIGAFIYTIALQILWWLSGRPRNSIEAAAADWLSEKIALIGRSTNG